jgi:toxin ParE1/3/4
VAVVRFSRRAEDDLLTIGAYALRIWGEAQADRYLNGLEACCKRLAESPLLGRICDEIYPDLQRPGLRRMEQGRHVVFYRQQGAGIFVSRILHRSMLPGKHGVRNEPQAD